MVVYIIITSVQCTVMIHAHEFQYSLHWSVHIVTPCSRNRGAYSAVSAVSCQCTPHLVHIRECGLVSGVLWIWGRKHGQQVLRGEGRREERPSMAVMNTLPWMQMRQWPRPHLRITKGNAQRQPCRHEWVRDIPGGGTLLGGRGRNGASRYQTGRGRAARDRDNGWG